MSGPIKYTDLILWNTYVDRNTGTQMRLTGRRSASYKIQHLFEFDTPSGEITLLPTDASGTVYREFDRAAPNGFRTNTKEYVLVKPPELLQQHLLNQIGALAKRELYMTAENSKRLAGLLREYAALKRAKKFFDPRLNKARANNLQRGRRMAHMHKVVEGGAKSLFHRQPGKDELRQYVAGWTGHSTQVQGMRRGNRADTTISTGSQYIDRQKIQALGRYMKTLALRSPQMPPGQFVNGREPVLYRGVYTWKQDALRGVLAAKRVTEPGFISMTRDLDVAWKFAAGNEQQVYGRRHQDQYLGMILKIDVRKGIPRGTPWVWYSNENSDFRQHRNWNRSWYPSEHEVLLPPGTFRLVGAPQEVARTIVMVEAVFEPDAQFLPKPKRKGAPANWNAHRLPSLF